MRRIMRGLMVMPLHGFTLSFLLCANLRYHGGL
jgi:hypothetical protein